MTEQVAPGTLARLSDAVDSMPPFPGGARRVLELSRELSCTPRELVQAIELDPVITAKLLRVANSPYYSATGPVGSVERAVLVLGVNTVKNLALSFASLASVPSSQVACFDTSRYVLHSVATAIIARSLCRRVDDGTSPMDCYTAGLLHDFGKAVLARHLAAEFQVALAKSAGSGRPLQLVEQEDLGANHATVGAMLLEKWAFPRPFVECIRDHHRSESGSTTLGACLYAADQIAKKLAYGDAGNPVVAELPASVAERIGDGYAGIVDSLGDLGRVLDEARFFARVGAPA